MRLPYYIFDQLLRNVGVIVREFRAKSIDQGVFLSAFRPQIITKSRGYPVRESGLSCARVGVIVCEFGV